MNPIKYTSVHGVECYKNVTPETPFDQLEFHKIKLNSNNDEEFQFALHTNIGSITVYRRRTGFTDFNTGCRIVDTETGFRNKRGDFWLATGNVDVRHTILKFKTIQDAINFIKNTANVISLNTSEERGKFLQKSKNGFFSIFNAIAIDMNDKEDWSITDVTDSNTGTIVESKGFLFENFFINEETNEAFFPIINEQLFIKVIFNQKRYLVLNHGIDSIFVKQAQDMAEAINGIKDPSWNVFDTQTGIMANSKKDNASVAHIIFLNDSVQDVIINDIEAAEKKKEELKKSFYEKNKMSIASEQEYKDTHHWRIVSTTISERNKNGY